MGWMTKLYETYENCKELAGTVNDDGTMLLPVAHSTQKAQIEIALNWEGNFRSAMVVPKADAETVIPVTEDSASRSSGNTPHPLCDKLVYIAGDYEKYVEDKKKKNFRKYFQKYISFLEQWKCSEFSNPKVNATYQYLIQEKVIRDLSDCGIVQLRDGKIDSSLKMDGVSQLDLFVRFRVEGISDNEFPEVWKDKRMYQDYIHFYLSSRQGTGICYVTGREAYCTDKHPSKIRHSGDKSKLISANDESGFTYRGRFVNKDETNKVSFEVSQEAHNALKWLIARQGISLGEMVLVAWGTCHADEIDIIGNRENMWTLYWYEKDAVDADNKYIWYGDTEIMYQRKLKSSIFGSQCDIEDDENIVVMAVEAATTGRLSITYYKEMSGSRYKSCIQKWHRNCVWTPSFFFKNDYSDYYFCTPTLKNIIRTTYGVEQNNLLKVKDNIMKAGILRLIPCVLEGKRVPKDMERRLILNASRPEAYSWTNWNKILLTACAVIKYNKEESSMVLKEENHSRDYLYGRMLAVAEYLERHAQTGDFRMTNAERYMAVFQRRPYTTWERLYKKLLPYIKKLRNVGQVYKKQIVDIMSLFEEREGKSEFKNDAPLSGEYLEGYSNQLSALYMRQIDNKNKKENEKQEVSL